MEEYLKRLWNDRINESDRKITLWTGEGGLNLFNKWIRLDNCKSILTHPIFSDKEIKELSAMLNSEDDHLVELGIAIIETKAKSNDLYE